MPLPAAKLLDFLRMTLLDKCIFLLVALTGNMTRALQVSGEGWCPSDVTARKPVEGAWRKEISFR